MTTSTSATSSSSNLLDVQSLVSQLMAVERQPIDKLNAKITTDQTQISSWGTISGLVSTFQTAIQSINSGVQGFSAASSNTSAFSATAASNSVPGTYSVSVSQLAQSQNLVATGQASDTAAIGNGTATTVTFDFGTISGGTLSSGTYSGAAFTSNGSGTKSITIDSTNNTLQGIRDAINAANMGVTATIVNDGSGTPYRLSLTSSSTGASNSLKITTSGGDGTINSLLGYDPAGTQNLNQTAAAQNANLTVNGIAITSSSNSVTNAVQGVTLALSNVTSTPSTLTIAHDTSTITSAVSSFVDAYNALYGQLKSRSSYGSATTSAGALAGDGTVHTMQDQLRNIFNTPASGGTMTYLTQIGVSFQTDGTLKLDSTQLNSAMTSNFSDVANLLSSSTGFATRLDTWATSALQSGDGLIASATSSLNTAITGYNNNINSLEARMTILQAQYTTQYSNLNMLLISMNSTSSYLTAQLA